MSLKESISPYKFEVGTEAEGMSKVRRIRSGRWGVWGFPAGEYKAGGPASEDLAQCCSVCRESKQSGVQID